MMTLPFGLFTQVSGLGPLGPLVFQVEQLSVTGESMCTKYWLTAKEV